MSTCTADTLSLVQRPVSARAEPTGGHAVGRDAIRDAVLAIERGRGGERPGVHDRATVWFALVGGRWSVVDHFERDGRRYFVAQQNEPAEVHVRALSAREHAIAHLVAVGSPNKFIAYSLGLAISTIATHLAAAKRKLGVTSRLELISLLTAFRPTRERTSSADAVVRRPLMSSSDGTVHVLEPELAGTSYIAISLASERRLADPLSPVEREIVNDVLAGLSNLEIATKRERSARTIANQLASIFRKLGVGSRFELTAQLTGAPPQR